MYAWFFVRLLGGAQNVFEPYYLAVISKLLNAIWVWKRIHITVSHVGRTAPAVSRVDPQKPGFPKAVNKRDAMLKTFRKPGFSQTISWLRRAGDHVRPQSSWGLWRYGRLSWCAAHE